MARKRAKALNAAEAKAAVLRRLAQGWRVADAMTSVERTVETYRDWRRNDQEFAAATKRARGEAEDPQTAPPELPDFPRFAERYLNQPLPLHQLRAWDVICGNAPRDLEPSMSYAAGEEPGRFMIMNFPPNHGKSTTW